MGTRTRRRRTPTNAKLSLKSTNFVQPKSLPTNLTTLHSFQSSSSVPVTRSSLILPSGKALEFIFTKTLSIQSSLNTRKSPEFVANFYSLYTWTKTKETCTLLMFPSHSTTGMLLIAAAAIPCPVWPSPATSSSLSLETSSSTKTVSWCHHCCFLLLLHKHRTRLTAIRIELVEDEEPDPQVRFTYNSSKYHWIEWIVVYLNERNISRASKRRPLLNLHKKNIIMFHKTVFIYSLTLAIYRHGHFECVWNGNRPWTRSKNPSSSS